METDAVYGKIKAILNMTGKLLVIGENGISKINGAALLDKKVAEKIDEIYAYMNIYYFGDFEKEELERTNNKQV